jgi:predicted chitinase
LQQWAQEKHQEIVAELAAIEKAQEERLRAQNEENDKVRLVEDLKAQLEGLKAEVKEWKEDPEKFEQLRNQQIIVAQQLANTLRSSLPEPKSTDIEVSVTSSAFVSTTFTTISTDKVKKYFADQFSGTLREKAESIIDTYLPPLVVELKKCGLTDTVSVANVLAQIAGDTASFRTVEEYSSGDEYEGRASLGNTNPGDGPRFKGRGLLQVTGRSNYTYFSQGLGYGTRLVDSPEDMLKPEIAAQAVCFYFTKVGGPSMLDALKNDDIERVTRKLTGNLNGIADKKQNLLKFKEILSQTNTANKN